MGTTIYFPIRNERGQGLIQVLIAVALMGVIATGFATMMSNMTNAQRDVQARSDLTALTQEIQTNFSSPQACTANLVAGTPFITAQAAVKYPPASGTFQNNGMPFAFKVGGDILQTGQTLKNYSLIANRVQMVNAGTVGVDTSGNQIYTASVIGQFSQKTGSHDFSTRVLASGYVTVNNGTIASCSTMAPPSLDQASANCTVLGGTYDTTTKKCKVAADLTDPQTVSALCTQFGGTYANGNCTVRAPASDMDLDADTIVSTICPQLGGTLAADGKCNIASSGSSGGPGMPSMPGPAACTGSQPRCSGQCGGGPGIRCVSIGAAQSCGVVASTGGHACQASCVGGAWTCK